MAPIIQSLLDTDLYKLTMMQVVFERYSEVPVQYTFKSRNTHILKHVAQPSKFICELRSQIQAFCSLKFTDEELAYLRTIRFLKPAFINYLAMFSLPSDAVSVSLDAQSEDVAITVSGLWVSTILFEVPVLAIVSELFTKHRKDAVPFDDALLVGLLRTATKVETFNTAQTQAQAQGAGLFAVYEAGTRRRYSRAYQHEILQQCVRKGIIAGTSNVMLAKAMNITPAGTMAHEYIAAHQQLSRIEDSQKVAFQTWADVYRGDLGIALSDTLGFSTFLHDFDMYFAKLFDGARHDSGDPDAWARSLIKHYEDMGIDPCTKVAVFSDGLCMSKAAYLYRTYSRRIKTSFIIGTHLVNDTLVKPLQIVMKMTQCNGRPVAKLSDAPGKEMCRDALYMSYIKSIFNK